jgi:peptidyl-prolyl cis-trans isomerase C
MIEPMPVAQAEHVLITHQDADTPIGSRSKEEARTLAQRIEREARAGAVFSELVARHSECPSKNRGGDLGRFGPGDRDPDLEAVVFQLKPGEIGFAETRYGFHVIRRRA